mmetsp:Transcript_31875/g.63120  ORF Transcript_31875/g.63120 Transcript_31875/m.63120 type:complete len:118 (+) Transcript_31875:1004-1357(+)
MKGGSFGYFPFGCMPGRSKKGSAKKGGSRRTHPRTETERERERRREAAGGEEREKLVDEVKDAIEERSLTGKSHPKICPTGKIGDSFLLSMPQQRPCICVYLANRGAISGMVKPLSR